MPARKAARRSAQERIPRYVLYGDDLSSRDDWSVNIEPLANRCRERGWRIEPHSHPHFGQLVLVRSGRGVITLDGFTKRFNSPCAIVIPLHCIHGYEYQKDSDGWVITVAEHYLRQINERLPEFNALWSTPAVIPLRRDDEECADIQDSIVKLEQELERKALGHIIAAEGYLTSIFLQLLRCADVEHTSDATATANEAKLVEDFRTLLEKHYREPWKVKDYCSVLNVSVAQLRSACDSVCGETPIKLVLARRLIEAKRNLVFSEMSVEEIAYWLGFSSPAYFTRFFKNETGEPPARFRTTARARTA